MAVGPRARWSSTANTPGSTTAAAAGGGSDGRASSWRMTAAPTPTDEQAGDHRGRHLLDRRRRGHGNHGRGGGRVDSGDELGAAVAAVPPGGVRGPPPRNEAPAAGGCAGHRGQRCGRPAQRQAQVVELGQPGPAVGTLGQVTANAVGLGRGELARDEPAEVVGGLETVTGRVVAHVELQVTVPEAAPGPDGELRHVVGRELQERRHVARRQALDLGQPQHGPPARRQLAERLRHQRPVLAGEQAVRRAGGAHLTVEGLRLGGGREPAGPAQDVERGVAGGGQQVGAEAVGCGQPTPVDGIEHAGEGLAHGVGGVVAVAGDRLRHPHGFGCMPAVQVVHRNAEGIGVGGPPTAGGALFDLHARFLPPRRLCYSDATPATHVLGRRDAC